MVFGCVLATGAQAETSLRYDNGVAKSHAVNTGVIKFLEALSNEESLDMSGTHYYGALQSAVEASSGLRDSILDMGAIFPQYLPADFPVNSYITELPGIVKTSVAMSGANTEFVLLHCQPCLDEFTNQNQFPLIMYANPTYNLISGVNSRIASPDDIVGKKMRAGGNYFRAWIEHFGGVAVSLNGAEIYEGMNSGIVDGTVGVLNDISGFGIEELVGSVTLLDVGAFHNASMFGVRSDFWKQLPVETRKRMIELAIDGQAETSVAIDKEVINVLDVVIPENDIEVITPSQDFVDAQAEFVTQQLADASSRATEKNQISGAEEMAQKFMEVTAKWNDLVSGIDATDPAEVSKLYREQIYSKLNMDELGM